MKTYEWVDFLNARCVFLVFWVSLIIKIHKSIFNDLLFGTGGQSQVDIAKLQWAENVTSRSFRILASEKFNHQSFVAIEGDGAISILRLCE